MNKIFFLTLVCLAHTIALEYGERLNIKHAEENNSEHHNANKEIAVETNLQQEQHQVSGIGDSSHGTSTDDHSEDNGGYSGLDEHDKELNPYTEEHVANSKEGETGNMESLNYNDNHFQHQQPEIHEVTKVIPVHKTLKVPVPHKVQKPLRIPVPVKVLEPYPVRIPVPFRVEKVVHVPVEKVVEYHVEKPVPYKVTKSIPVPVFKPVPVPVPVYKLKLILHSDKYHHKD